MNKKLIFIIAVFSAVCMLVSCSDRPLKRENLDPETLKELIYDTEGSRILSDKSEQNAQDVQNDSSADESVIEDEKTEAEVTDTEVIDTHVYTGDELTDELILEKIVGYWETGDYGYLRGYNFFETGFLQLVLQRKVNQTGIYIVRYGGVYYSLDSKTWDDDILIIESISHDEIVGRFGDNYLILHRADASLVEENSGDGLIDNDNSGGTVVDAATEVGQNVKVN